MREREGWSPRRVPGCQGDPFQGPNTTPPTHTGRIITSSALRDVGFQGVKERTVRNREGGGQRHLGFGRGEGMGRGEERGAGISILPDPADRQAGRRSLVRAGAGMENGKRTRPANATPFPARSPPAAAAQEAIGGDAGGSPRRRPPASPRGRAPGTPRALASQSGAEVWDASPPLALSLGLQGSRRNQHQGERPPPLLQPRRLYPRAEPGPPA